MKESAKTLKTQMKQMDISSIEVCVSGSVWMGGRWGCGGKKLGGEAVTWPQLS